MIRLITGMGFGTKSEGLFTDIYRVLYIRRKENWMIAIPVEPKNSSGRTYFVSHKWFALDEVEAKISVVDGPLCVINITPSPFLLMSDDEVLKRVKSKERRSKTRLLNIRDERWSLIKPLLQPDTKALLFDKAIFPSLLKKRAQELEQDKKEQCRIYKRIVASLYQYWAGGSHKNALIPHLLKCGGAGKSKTRGDKKLGRPNAPTAAGISGQSGYQLADKDIEIIEHCWKHFLIRGTTVGRACRRMWTEFYSDHILEGDGKRRHELWPVHMRPTEAQFRYHGEKETALTARQKLAKIGQFEYRERPLAGSANEGVWTVGQQVAIDSTPVDVELVSIVSRLDRIGIANRVLLVDALHGYIPGFYQGLTPACGETVKLAVYHAMMDKTQWLENLGLSSECPPEDWLTIQFQSLIGDNTDARAEGVYEGLIDSGVLLSINHVPTYRSDLNALVETSHHSIHRLGDHKQLGTNHGRRSERGEKRAELTACHTLLESIRDTTKTIHTLNTKEMPDSILTLAMRRDGVRPTRLEMSRWEIEQGNEATMKMGIEQARSQLLPIHEGVFTESGVRLLRPETGKKKVFIRELKYISKDPRILNAMAQARSNGTIDAQFRVDPFDIRKIWYLHIESGELLELTLKTRDLDLANEATLFDVVQLEKQTEIDRFFIRENQERAVTDLEQRLDEGNRTAQVEYNNALKKHGKPLSQAEIKGGKKNNRKKERDSSFYGLPMVIHEDDLESHQERRPLEDEQTTDKSSDETLSRSSSSSENNIFKQALTKEGSDDETT